MAVKPRASIPSPQRNGTTMERCLTEMEKSEEPVLCPMAWPRERMVVIVSSAKLPNVSNTSRKKFNPRRACLTQICYRCVKITHSTV